MTRPSATMLKSAAMLLVASAGFIAYAQTPAPPPAAAPQTQAPVVGGYNFKNGAQLLEVIDLLAQELKINYVLDPAVPRTASVVLNTYGTVRDVDVRQLLETILRMNNLAMVKVGDMYRIVPAANVARLPVEPVTQMDATKFADDDHLVLNLVFLHFMNSPEMLKILEPFKGEGAQITSYDPANLLIILDSSRNMRRTLDLINMFDSATFAGQRVRTFEVKFGRPTDLSKELETVFKAYSLSSGVKGASGSGGGGAVQFVPLDRINTILAVAPNPGVFSEVETWLTKLDIPSQVTAGAVSNYVYHLKYQRAEVLGAAVGQLYGIPVSSALSSMYAASTANTSYPANGGIGSAGGGFGGGQYGGGYGNNPGYGNQGYGGGYGGNQYGNGYGGQYAPQTQAAPMTPFNQPSANNATGNTQPAVNQAGGATPTDQTGTYLGAQEGFGFDVPGRPRIVPNPFDNTVLVRSTPAQWEEIQGFLDRLDISPRQVLIEAKIYEVDLTGSMSAGVEAFLRARTTASRLPTGSLANGEKGPVLSLSAGTLVGQARELFAAVNANELQSRTKVLSSPSVIATDSIPAAITVGNSVPTLSSQSVNPGVTSGGTNLFTNTITNVSTGTGLNIVARVNPSGVVTMIINQTVTAPVSTSTSSIDSPSFSQRNVSTQVTVDDGDMIAIGGIIDESTTQSSQGIPFLDRIPWLSFLFGSRSSSKQRTELIVFLTPHVIRDTHQIADATEQLRQQMKGLRKIIDKDLPAGPNSKTTAPPESR